MPDRASGLDEADRAYVAAARAAAQRLGVRDEGPDASRDALADLEEMLPVDADPPAASPSPAARAVKSTVKRLVRWYFGYLASQVTALGEATVRLGSHLAERVDRLDTATSAQAVKIEQLERRVRQLEDGSGERR